MNDNMIKIKYRGLFRGFALVLIFLICSNSILNAQKKSKKKKPEFDVEFGLVTYYDDNILKYSKKYLDRFLNNEDEGRFHIETYDDVIISPALELSASYRLFGKMESVFSVDADYSKYVNNDIKSWSTFGVGYRQYINKRLNFSLNYDDIPEFYIRHFRDDDWTAVYGYTEETFTPYSFAKDNFGVWCEYKFFKNTRVRLYYQLAKYYHNKHYTEFDSDNHLYRIKIFQPLHKNFNLEASYQFTRSLAKGYDEPGGSKETSDAGDATFDEDGYTVGLTWKLPRVKNRYHSLEFETIIFNRYYQTDKSPIEDDMHSGRVDNNLRFYLTYYLSISRDFKFKAFYKWYGRDSGTTSPINEEFVSDEKDYRQNQFGLEFIYRIGL